MSDPRIAKLEELARWASRVSNNVPLHFFVTRTECLLFATNCRTRIVELKSQGGIK